ncbi:MAG TPA: manganese efflux pump MntP family protein [Firmicutes bacterium]|nr:manganese efflux pump MntP family protein [Bacillota bacterium]
MDFISLTGIAVGLAMDAFAVSVTNGAVTKKVNLAFALRMSVCFGVFQAFMPFIGWLIGTAGAGFISSIDHWIALILLAIIGGQMLRESFAHHKEPQQAGTREALSWKMLFAMAVATSIDALATGIILPGAVGADSVPLMLLSVGIIGLITLVLCTAGVFIGKKFGSLLSSKAELAGGIVLIAIGVKIFVEHMFFGG